MPRRYKAQVYTKDRVEAEKLALYQAQLDAIRHIEELQDSLVRLWAAYLGDQDPAHTHDRGITLAVLLSNLNMGLTCLGEEVRHIRIRYYGSEGPNVIPAGALQPSRLRRPPKRASEIEIAQLAKDQGGPRYIIYNNHSHPQDPKRSWVAHLRDYTIGDAFWTFCGRIATKDTAVVEATTDRSICYHCQASAEQRRKYALAHRYGTEKYTHGKDHEGDWK